MYVSPVILIIFVMFSISIAVDKNEKQELDTKKALSLGMEMLKENDPDFMKETLSLLKDPETMKEVRKMMEDPVFKAEVERLKQSSVHRTAVDASKDLYGDAEKAAKVQAELATASLSDAQLGMQELAKASKNPKMLAEAMEMMKDPEIAKEVQAMMNDPQFKAEMEKFTKSPQFKKSMDNAAHKLEAMQDDPVKMKMFEADIMDQIRN